MIDPAQQGGAHAPEGTRGVPVFTPAADIFETADAIVAVLEMPGADPNSLKITLDKRVLTVSGQSKWTPPNGYTLYHAEFRQGDYERSFTLSETIDDDAIQAQFKDGLLKLTLPKSKPEPAKTIKIAVE